MKAQKQNKRKNQQTKGRNYGNKKRTSFKNGRAKKTNNRKRILRLLTGMFASEFLLPNGNFNKMKLAKETGISISTIKRHFKELQANGELEKIKSENPFITW